MNKTETPSTVLLQHHLQALKRPTLHAECEKVAARGAKDNVEHLGFRLQLCERELLDRERRAAERRLPSARFPTPQTLESFDFAAQPSVNRTLLTELMPCASIDNRENILWVGNSGTGKTHLATALAIAACGRGKKVRFWRVTERITQLMEAREERTRTRRKGQPTKLERLAVQDQRRPDRATAALPADYDVLNH